MSGNDSKPVTILTKKTRYNSGFWCWKPQLWYLELMSWGVLLERWDSSPLWVRYRRGTIMLSYHCVIPAPSISFWTPAIIHFMHRGKAKPDSQNFILCENNNENLRPGSAAIKVTRKTVTDFSTSRPFFQIWGPFHKAKYRWILHLDQELALVLNQLSKHTSSG